MLSTRSGYAINSTASRIIVLRSTLDSECSFFARAPLGCDVFRGRERDVRDESASVCLGGAGRQCIEAVLPLATDEVRVDVRVPIRPTRQCRGKSLYKTQPACIQVRETV